MKSKELHRINNLNYYYNRRNALIQQLGGKCVICGNTENLQFDHINSSEKSFGISSHIQNSIDSLQTEINKCQLLCHNCHIIKSKECKDISVKINKDIAIAICNDYFSTNMTQAEIGQKYGITQRTVSSIVRGERWIKETSSVDRSSIDQITKYKTKIYQEVSVVMIDIITGNIIKTYNSMSEAIQDDHKSSHISQCCNGKKKTYHGFIWKKHVE